MPDMYRDDYRKFAAPRLSASAEEAVARWLARHLVVATAIG